MCGKQAKAKCQSENIVLLQQPGEKQKLAITI